jgi:hypothetical protein
MVDIAATNADLEAAVRALMTRAHSGCKVYKSADQTTANYTGETMVAWDAEDYDNGGWHDNVTNNTRMTVPSGVTRVDISARVEANLGTTNTAQDLQIYKNGAFLQSGVSGAHKLFSSSTNQVVNINVMDIPVAAGDYFELRYVQTDSSVTVEGDAAANASWFAIKAVG